MKFRAHETFSIRKNWLAKGIRGISERGDVFTAKDASAMDYFGIGRNMVYSLRYWLSATGIAKEEKDTSSKKTVLRFTELGKLIFENDPYVQELGTLWLLQYKLSSNFLGATSWYYFFNEFNLSEFRREDFVSALQNFVSIKIKVDDKEKMPALRSLEDDFDCIINTYVSRFRTGAKEIDPEDNLDSPLAELGLIDIQDKNKKLFRKVIPPKQNIPALILLAILSQNAKEYRSREILLSDILVKNCFVAKVFNLDTITLMEVLSDLENTNYLKIVRTAGLDVVRVVCDLNFYDCVKKYYEELKK